MIQGLPFLGDQPGNGQGNPPPFEPPAPIDEYTGYIFLAVIVLACVILMVNSVRKHFKKQKDQTDWLEKYYEDEF